MAWGAIAAPIAASLISSGAGLIGGKMQADSAAEAARINADIQREFAQNGVRWKVEDAKAAGLHPLAALGANTASPSAVAVGDTGMGNAVANMGQDISRAIHATRTNNERVDAIAKLQLEGAQLDNDYKRSLIAKMNQAPNPPIPGAESALIDGQGNSNRTSIVPVEINASEKGSVGKEAGFIPDYTYSLGHDGSMNVIPSKAVKEHIEDQLIPEFMWGFRNHLQTALTGPPIPKADPGRGRKWSWDPLRHKWTNIAIGSGMDGYYEGVGRRIKDSFRAPWKKQAWQ